MNATASASVAMTSVCLRPLKWNELVKRGDFVGDGRKGFEPWVGPAGFRADAFIKTIYRRSRQQAADSEKLP